jgi:hypothetical protein
MQHDISTFLYSFTSPSLISGTTDLIIAVDNLVLLCLLYPIFHLHIIIGEALEIHTDPSRKQFVPWSNLNGLGTTSTSQDIDE